MGRPYIVIAYDFKRLLATCEFHVHISLREQSQIDKRLKAFIQPGSNSSGLTSSESLGCHFAPGEPWSQRGLGGSMVSFPGFGGAILVLTTHGATEGFVAP